MKKELSKKAKNHLKMVSNIVKKVKKRNLEKRYTENSSINFFKEYYQAKDPSRPDPSTAFLETNFEKLKNISRKKDKLQKETYDDPLMQSREEKAIEELKKKFKSTGIAYNKGGYMYIGNYSAEDLKTLGKK